MRGNGYYSCANHVHAASCPQTRIIDRDVLERRVLGALVGPLTAPRLVAATMKAYKEEAQRLNQEQHSSRKVWVKELKQTEKSLQEIVHAIEAGGFSRTLNERRQALEEKRDDLEERLEATPLDEILIPSLTSFRDKIEKLVVAIGRSTERAEAIDLIRRLIRRIEIKAEVGWRTPIRLTVYGDLAALLGTQINTGANALVIATV